MHAVSGEVVPPACDGQDGVHGRGVEDDGGVWIPLDFARMSVGAYLNHADTPNAHHDADYAYYASRDLAPGEEVLIDYGRL